jgi:hypothetical protein
LSAEANKIKSWLEEEGLEHSEISDPNTKLTFSVKSGGNVISVGFHKDSKDSIIIKSQITFSDEEQHMLKFVKTKYDIVWQLQRFLVQMRLEPIIKWNENRDAIETLAFQRTIFYDGLTKDRFYEVLTDVFHCTNIIRESFVRLGKPS